MNTIYRLVWNVLRSAWVVTHEHASAHGRGQSPTRRARRAALVLALCSASSAPSFALPVGPQVVAGSASLA